MKQTTFTALYTAYLKLWRLLINCRFFQISFFIFTFILLFLFPLSFLPWESLFLMCWWFFLLTKGKWRQQWMNETMLKHMAGQNNIMYKPQTFTIELIITLVEYSIWLILHCVLIMSKTRNRLHVYKSDYNPDLNMIGFCDLQSLSKIKQVTMDCWSCAVLKFRTRSRLEV